MSRKILFIIIGALLFLALLALLWLWFINRTPDTELGSPSGFGTSTDRGGSGTTGGTGGNAASNVNGGGTTSGPGVDYNVTQTPDGYLISTAGGLGTIAPGTYQVKKGSAIVGSYKLDSNGIGKYNLTGGNLPSGTYTFTPFVLGNTGIGGSINTGGGIDTGGGIPIGGDIPPGDTIDTGGDATTPDTGGDNTTPPEGALSGAWIGSSISQRIFSPSDIADITNPGTVGGTPLISTTPQPASVNTSGLIIGATAAACLAQWVANQVAGAVAFLDPVVATSLFTDVPSLDKSAAKQRTSQNVITCIVKTIAQAAIDQITRSVVNWINSGFNGQPSFVTNFNQYFANVADQAAGEFIKGSALSFLCSPFSAQIKIAIAQSYANRNSAASCSLTKVTNNVNGFLRGGWSNGGWGSMLQLTTMPTNNRYGAYAYGEISLKGYTANARNVANRNISPGGFIAVQKCKDSPLNIAMGPGQGTAPKNCETTTPGKVIEDSLKTSLDSSVNQLQVAQNIDEIIRALVNQLILKSLYGGLANANTGVTNPLAPAIDQAASAQAQALLVSLQSSATAAVQFATVKQGSASDIQQVQNNFNTAFNCWETAATSSALSADLRATASQNAAAADVQIDQLQTRVDAYNEEITRANTSLSIIQNLQSQVMFAATPEDVQAATIAVQAATPTLLGQADVTTAQQDRAALQTQLTATNTQAQNSLSQCRAFGA